jgi:flagellar hook-associated protein 3 FlgL
MRISEKHRHDLTNTRIESAKADNVDNLEQLATLKKINRISDDPIGTSKVIRGRDSVKNMEQFNKNVDFSRGFLEKTEASLGGIVDNLIRAKEISVLLANASYDASSRSAVSEEVKQIISEVISLANSSYANRFVFSGFRTHTPALSLDGTYLGDDGAIFVQIDDTSFRQINIQARELFEASPEERAANHCSMIDSINMLKVGLEKNDVPLIHQSMNELDHQLEKATGARAKLGALYGALNAAAGRLSLNINTAKENLSKVEEADIFKATSDFKRSESVLQNTLMASNKMLQPSLINFIK